jgi:hypothetical protein
MEIDSSTVVMAVVDKDAIRTEESAEQAEVTFDVRGSQIKNETGLQKPLFDYLTSLNVAFNAHLQILVERETNVNTSQFYTAKK